MLNLVLLPATEPGDETYGIMPGRVEAYPAAVVHPIHFPTMVWYNESIRNAAIAQIQSLEADPVILVGFSKSGLGAWNIARTIPQRISGTIIFDAPVARDALPPWGTAPFYSDDASWQEDLPIRTVPSFHAAMPEGHRLVLVSGVGFHDEMCVFSRALLKTGVRHVFLSRPQLKHHWNSGWIEAALSELIRMPQGVSGIQKQAGL